MKLTLFTTLLLAICFNPLMTNAQVAEDNSNYKIGLMNWQGEWVKKDTSNQPYPCTLDSTIIVFFNTWEDSIIWHYKNIPDTALALYDRHYGSWLRNSYGLWSRTCLSEYFWKLGIIHPDDISAIILTSFHRYLNGQDIDLDNQVQMFKDFWKETQNIVYSVEDSANWQFPPSLWDFGSTIYEKKE